MARPQTVILVRPVLIAVHVYASAANAMGSATHPPRIPKARHRTSVKTRRVNCLIRASFGLWRRS